MFAFHAQYSRFNPGSTKTLRQEMSGVSDCSHFLWNVSEETWLLPGASSSCQSPTEGAVRWCVIVLTYTVLMKHWSKCPELTGNWKPCTLNTEAETLPLPLHTREPRKSLGKPAEMFPLWNSGVAWDYVRIWPFGATLYWNEYFAWYCKDSSFSRQQSIVHAAY